MKPHRQDLIIWVVRCVLGALFLIYLGVLLRQGMLDGIPPQFLVINLLLASIPMLLVLFAVGLLVEAVMTIDPARRGRIVAAAACRQRKTPERFTASVCCHTSHEVSRSG